MRKGYPLGRGGATWTLGRGGNAWALARRSAAAAQTTGHGVRGSARLQATDGDDLLLGPDPQCEGAAAAPETGILLLALSRYTLMFCPRVAARPNCSDPNCSDPNCSDPNCSDPNCSDLVTLRRSNLLS